MKEDDEKIDWSIFPKFIFPYLKSRIFWLLSDLTNFFPFSLLLYRFRFHKDFEDYNLAITVIYEQLRKHSQYGALFKANFDHTFVYLQIFLPFNQQRFQRKLNKLIGENNFYIHEEKENFYKINIVRGKMDRSMLLLYNAFSSKPQKAR